MSLLFNTDSQRRGAQAAIFASKAIEAVTDIALSMPPGPITQGMLLEALLKAYAAGWESRQDDCLKAYRAGRESRP